MRKSFGISILLSDALDITKMHIHTYPDKYIIKKCVSNDLYFEMTLTNYYNTYNFLKFK